MSKPRITTNEQDQARGLSTHFVFERFLCNSDVFTKISDMNTFYELQKKHLPQCVYCEEPATTRDHVPPRCWAPLSKKTYPACHRCNCKILVDKAFLTLEARQEYVRQWRLARGEIT